MKLGWIWGQLLWHIQCRVQSWPFKNFENRFRLSKFNPKLIEICRHFIKISELSIRTLVSKNYPHNFTIKGAIKVRIQVTKNWIFYKLLDLFWNSFPFIFECIKNTTATAFLSTRKEWSSATGNNLLTCNFTWERSSWNFSNQKLRKIVAFLLLRIDMYITFSITHEQHGVPLQN